MTATARWRGVIALSVAVTTSWGVLYYAFGVFLPIVARDLGASQAVVGGAFSAALLAAAAASGPAGRALDRWGARPVMVIAGALGALGFALFSGVHGVAALYAVWVVIGASHAGVLYEPACAAVTRWFPEPAARSRALLLLTSGGGFASTLFLPLAALLCERHGWRDAVLVLAATLAVVTLPLHGTLPATPVHIRPPRDGPPEPAPRGVNGLAAVLTVQSFVSAGVSVYVVSHLHASGMTVQRAAALAGVMGAAQVPGRVLFALLVRHASPRLRLPALLAAQSLALLGIATLHGPMLLVALAVFGAANGMVTLERATLVADRFGIERFGAVNGRIASWALAGRAAAPLVVGVAATATGTHVGPFLVLAGLLAAAASLT